MLGRYEVSAPERRRAPEPAAMLAASAQLHSRGDFGGRAGGPGGGPRSAASPGPLARLSELREEAYCKVLRVFVVQQLYDLVRPAHAGAPLQCASLLPGAARALCAAAVQFCAPWSPSSVTRLFCGAELSCIT